jgi:predicted pyridoxine 5'-phosphate oxidase superfamily flavin-nucleotide-binding protein
MGKPGFTSPSGQDGAFHEGELAVQRATGAREIAERTSRMLSSAIAASPAAFLAQQRMLVLASVDDGGAVWASLIFGGQGFASSPNGEALTLDLGRAHIAPEDPVLRNLGVGSMLGVLAIELGSRRRYRVNGFVSSSSEARVELAVREAYVNCPKYIQRRHLSESNEPRATSAPGARGTVLDLERQLHVRRADTMFVASRHPSRGADASHRGGEPGFLEIRDERTIRVPEYPGNGLYNTLGNLLVSEHAGLAVVDFDGGRVLQLTGSASVVLEGAPYWDFVISSWTEHALPKTLRWELLDRSPFNPPLTM